MDHTCRSEGGPRRLPMAHPQFIDEDAEFLFVPTDEVAATAEREKATPYDTAGAELGHRGNECSFDAFCRRYHLLEKDPALILLAKIVNGADTDNSLWNQPESWGLKAIAEGFRHIGLRDDHEINRAEWIVYDALYAYCRQCVGRGQSEGAFRKAS